MCTTKKQLDELIAASKPIEQIIPMGEKCLKAFDEAIKEEYERAGHKVVDTKNNIKSAEDVAKYIEALNDNRCTATYCSNTIFLQGKICNNPYTIFVKK